MKINSHIIQLILSIFLLSLILLSSPSSIIAAKKNRLSKKIDYLTPSNLPDDIPIFDKDNNKLFLDQFEGQTILIYFWATWSISSKKELPELDILQKDFRNLPFKVIAISEDFQKIDIIEKFYKQYEIRYLEIFYDYKNQLFKKLNIVGIPTSFLVTPDGKKIMSFTGEINWYDDELRELITSNIGGNHPTPKNSYKDPLLNTKIKDLKPISTTDSTSNSTKNNENTNNNDQNQKLSPTKQERKTSEEHEKDKDMSKSES